MRTEIMYVTGKTLSPDSENQWLTLLGTRTSATCFVYVMSLFPYGHILYMHLKYALEMNVRVIPLKHHLLSIIAHLYAISTITYVYIAVQS